MPLASSTELANDVGGAETLLERQQVCLFTRTPGLCILLYCLQELKGEMEAKKPAIQAFGAFGNQLLVQNHYAADAIKEKLDSLTRDVLQLDR